jgi:hypothetical protein
VDEKPHIGLKRLIAYRQGALPSAERDALQEHLSLCKRCTERLLELRDFEAASARGDAAGPEVLREEAWESLARQLPAQESNVRPIVGAIRREAPRPRAPRFVYGAAAALLLALIGLSVWAVVTVQQDRQRLARLEQQLKDRDEALATAQRSLTEAERQLAAARTRPEGEGGRVRELEAQVAELTSIVEELRRTAKSPGVPERLAGIDLSVAPRFVLRGQEPASGTLQGGGAVNPVRASRAGRITVALGLADRSLYPEYRFELVDRDGQVLWAGRRPGRTLLGDAGTTVSISGLDPGRYRFRVEGLQPDRTELLGEYLLEVATL